MKTNPWLFLTVTLFAGLLVRTAQADQRANTNLPPLLPPPGAIMDASAVAPAAPAPMMIVDPAPPAKKAVVKKKSTKPATKSAKAHVSKPAAPKLFEVSVPLKPGPATVAATRVNVRAQATTRSEAIGHLTNGEPVTVIEEITRENHKANEPTVWAKIALPEAMHSWVFGQFIDPANKTVSVKKLNVRSGPGENYTIVGQLLKGDAINQVGDKDGWLEIGAPSNAIAYVAAAYLKQEVPPTVVEAAPIVAAPPTGAPSIPPTPIPAPEAEPALAQSPAMPPPNLPVILDPSIKREVEREGIVRRTWSIQAPSDYRLVSADTGENVVYLHSPTPQLDLGRYKGLRVIVTGEEGLDRRWKDTPVLNIRRIQPIE